MNEKKKVLFCILPTAALAFVAIAGIATNGRILTKAQYTNPTAGTWVHYAQKAPTSSADGIREYWVSCSTHEHQFTAPAEGNIVNYDVYDTTGFAVDDDRLIKYQYDEDHLPLSEYAYGAGMYCTNVSDFKNWRITYGENNFNCNLYSEGGTYLWRIDLPRIDFTKYPTVTMDVKAPNWYENNNMGPEADQLTYHTNFGGNKTEGKIKLTLGPSGLHMEFNSLEYASTLAFERTFTDSDILHGLKSAYFFTEDLYDRYLNIENIVLSTVSSKTAIMHFNGDTTKLSTENAKTVGTPNTVDYEIINNDYGASDNSLAVVGNDTNTGSVAITMPAVNLNSYLSTGVITFTFGVRNNGERMYWGSGDGKVDLGNNDTGSQSNNYNGYVNWQLQITSSSARIYNVYQERFIDVTLSEAMLNGTAGMVISGGSDCRWRYYFVTDIYWSASI